MGLGDFLEKTNQVLTIFKADTSDLKAKMRDMTEEQKKLASEQLLSAERWNKGLQKVRDGLDHVKKGIDFSATAIGIAADAWQSYERAALKAGGADAQRAREFRHALDTWNSGMEELKITIGSMVAALAPLVELAGRIVKSAFEFINAQATKDGKTFVSQRDVALQEMGFGENGTNIIGAALERDMRHQRATAEILGREAVREVLDAWGAGMFREASKLDADEVREKAREKGDEILRAFTDGLAGGLVGTVRPYYQSGAYDRAMRERKGPEPFSLQEYGAIEVPGGFTPGMAKLSESQKARNQKFRDWVMQAPADGELGAGVGGFDQSVLEDPYFHFKKYQDAMADAAAARDRFFEGEKDSILRSIFGTPEEFSFYREGMEGIASTFNAFATAATAGFSAWVDGSKTASEAIKQFGVDFLKGVAMNMWAKSLEHAAAAIGSLAFGDGSGAAKHGIAAGLYAAGAVAIGGAARAAGKSMEGGGGLGTSTRHSAGAPRLAGGGGSGQREEVINIYMGDTLAPDNPRVQRLNVARAIRNARREIDSETSYS